MAVGLGLCVIEGGLRLTGYRPLPTVPVTRNQDILYQYTKFRPSSRLTWELTPGWRGQEGGAEVVINSASLRERELPLRKPAGTRRILVLGDSVAFGHWVAAEAAFPRQLEGALQPHVDGTLEVINAGVPGYSTFQELAWLEHAGWAYEPDLIVVGFVLNDVVERYMTMAAYGGANTVLGVDTTVSMNPLSRLLRRTAFHRFIVDQMQDRARRREIYSVRRLFEATPAEEIREAWAQSEEELSGIVAAAAARDIPVWVVAFPFRFQITEALEPLPQQHLQRWATAAGVDYVDLTPTFARMGGRDAFLDHDHPTPRGHQQAAAVVAAALLQRRPAALFPRTSQERQRVP